jgi:hypothetical protein
MKNIDYVGTEINGLKIVEYYVANEAGGRRPRFKCLCVCGKIFAPRAEAIKNGTTKSCGCKSSELSALSHTLEDNAAVINLIYRNYKQTAIRRSISFNLSLEEFKPFLSQNCIYCGNPPQPSIFSGSEKYGRKEKQFSYNGIDRVDSNADYVLDNCVTCCSICNRAKSDMSLEDFKNWIKQLVLFTNRG